MPKLLVSGRLDPSPPRPQPGSGRFLQTRVLETVLVEGTRADGGVVELDVAEDDLLELTLEDGITWWVSFDRLQKDLRWTTTRGDRTPGDVVRLTPTIRVGEPSRGPGGLGLKVVKRLGLDLPRAGAQFIAERLESRLEPGPGLYRCPSPRHLGAAAQPEDLAGDRPALVLLHGTASSAEGSFGGLAAEGAGAWDALRRDYGERIFAFEHHTLTQSPLDNAAELLDRLPRNARLHLVSHSRGGLVGEILARGHAGRTAFAELDFQVFERDRRDRAGDVDAMRRLNALLGEKQVRVERFVRVACPAAGTTLASGRLDLYLNVLFNLLKRLPFLQQTLVFDFLADLTKAVAKQRIDPASLPGLEAMMPESPLVRVLNNPNHVHPSELTVIAGDVKASGFLRRLQILAADLYYGSEHDLVVNTDAMYGGAPRTVAPRYYFAHNERVDHFRYFLNPETRQGAARRARRAHRPGDGLPRAAAPAPRQGSGARRAARRPRRTRTRRARSSSWCPASWAARSRRAATRCG